MNVMCDVDHVFTTVIVYPQIAGELEATIDFCQEQLISATQQ